jgi:hypothetical protein
VSPFDPERIADECFGGVDPRARSSRQGRRQKNFNAFVLVYERSGADGGGPAPLGDRSAAASADSGPPQLLPQLSLLSKGSKSTLGTPSPLESPTAGADEAMALEDGTVRGLELALASMQDCDSPRGSSHPGLDEVAPAPARGMKGWCISRPREPLHFHPLSKHPPVRLSSCEPETELASAPHRSFPRTSRCCAAPSSSTQRFQRTSSPLCATSARATARARPAAPARRTRPRGPG